MFEHRIPSTDGDKKRLTFLDLAAETGNSVETRAKTVHKVQSFHHASWEVMRNGLNGKSAQRCYVAEFYIEHLNGILNRGKKP